MKNWILILAPMFLMITVPDIRAHDVVTVNGNVQNHQHVYRRQQYGKPLQQGHRFQSTQGGSMTLWGSEARPGYGKSTARRRGPVIGDQTYRPGAKPHESGKYGAAVNGYGKAVNGYGKAVKGYSKPDRNR